MIIVLLAFAFVFFVIGALCCPPPSPPGPWWGRFNPVSAGLACWVATELFRNWLH